jgi:hypothetical protein
MVPNKMLAFLRCLRAAAITSPVVRMGSISDACSVFTSILGGLLLNVVNVALYTGFSKST